MTKQAQPYKMKHIIVLMLTLMFSYTLNATSAFQRMRIAKGIHSCNEVIPTTCFDLNLPEPTWRDTFTIASSNLYLIRTQNGQKADTIPLNVAIGKIINVTGLGGTEGVWVIPVDPYFDQELKIFAAGQCGLIGGKGSEVNINNTWDYQIEAVDAAITEIKKFEKKHWKEIYPPAYSYYYKDADFVLNKVWTRPLQTVVWLYQSDYSAAFINEFVDKIIELSSIAKSLYKKPVLTQQEMEQYKYRSLLLHGTVLVLPNTKYEVEGPPAIPPGNTTFVEADSSGGSNWISLAELKQKLEGEGCSIKEVCFDPQSKDINVTLECKNNNGQSRTFKVVTGGDFELGFETEDGHSASLSADASGKVDMSVMYKFPE